MLQRHQRTASIVGRDRRATFRIQPAIEFTYNERIFQGDKIAMNMQPILQQLSREDFQKMLVACQSPRERFYLEVARADPDFEYHIDLPGPDGPEAPQPMNVWLDDKTRFPDD